MQALAERIPRYTRPGLWDGNMVDGYLLAAARATPARTAVIDRGTTWSYGDLDAMVTRMAAALHGRGIARGDVVSWMLPNWTEAVVVHHAALRLGAVSNPIVPIYRQAETSFILRESESKAVFVPSTFRGFDYAGMLAEIRADLPSLRTVVVVGDTEAGRDVEYSSLMAEPDAPLSPAHAAGPDRDPNDPVLLLYTSGTTSTPKGALHTHNTLDYENRSIIDFYGLSGRDVVFMPSPVSHITGVLFGLQLPFMLRSAVVLLDRWDPGRALQLIAAHRCSFMVAATPFLHGIVHHPELRDTDTSSMRAIVCGGADVPPDLVKDATAALGCMVSRAYGSTEYPTATGSNAGDPLSKRAETDGRAIGEARLRIVDDLGTDVPAGHAGEVLVQGPEMFIGYLDPELNAEAFTEDGWFRTGDLGRRDADGFLEITSRKKDIIIRGGENISAKEIEDALFGHPKIADVAVVASPDPVLAERVCAVIVPQAGQSVGLDEITAWLTHRKLAKQKFPEEVILLGELPRTASGKVQKFQLRELAAQRATAKAAGTGTTRLAGSGTRKERCGGNDDN